MNYLKLDKLLSEKNITNRILAELVNAPEWSINAVVSGRYYPRFDLLISISQALDVPLRSLFKENESVFSLQA